MNSEIRQKLDTMKKLSEVLMENIRNDAMALQKSETSTKESLKEAQKKLDDITRILNKE